MNARHGLLFMLALALFGAAVIYAASARASVRCEVCLELDGQLVCRAGAGETRLAAMQAAVQSTCGPYGLACQSLPPRSARCEGEE